MLIRYIIKRHQKQLAKQSEVQREKTMLTLLVKRHKKKKATLKPWYTYHSIAHAMGGLDGKDYLNSIDGFYPAYQKGYRVLKWTSFLLRTTLRLVSTNGVGNFLIQPVKKATQSVTVNSKITKIYGKYTPTSFLDVLNLMEKYP